MVLDDRLGPDLRQAAPLFLPTAAIGVTFGAHADPALGPVNLTLTPPSLTHLTC